MAEQAETENKRVLEVVAEKGNQDAALAKVYSTPSLNAASLQLTFNPNSELNLMACMEEMKEQFAAINKGDTRRIESMLIGQAHSLQAMFTFYANKMAAAEYLSSLKVYSAIALKTQNQCRQTLSALAEIKKPKRTTFVKNQATNQQINMNGKGEIPEKNTPILSNELLSEAHHATMDNIGTTTATGANKELATLENGRR